MQSYILEGSVEKRDTYISDFITENNIKNYNIIRFEEKIKINDIRTVIKTMFIKQSEKKLFIVSSDMTIDAQNALLKTLEELPENVIFIFSLPTKDILLPTVISRCFVINTGIDHTNNKMNNVFESLLTDLILHSDNKNQVLFNTLKLAEQVEKSDNSKVVEEIIEILRNILKGIFYKERVELTLDGLKKIDQFLEKLNNYYSNYKNNNVNKRMLVEKICFEVFLK